MRQLGHRLKDVKMFRCHWQIISHAHRKVCCVWMNQLLIQKTQKNPTTWWWVQGQKNERGCQILGANSLANCSETGQTPQCLSGLLKDILTTGSLTDCGSSFLFLERVQLLWWTNEGKMEGKKGLFVLPGNGSQKKKKKKTPQFRWLVDIKY